MNNYILIIFILLSLIPTGAYARAGECEFTSTPRVIENSRDAKKGGLLLEWNHLSPALLRSRELPRSRSFIDYRRTVSAALEVDPLLLLNRYLNRAKNPDDLHNLKIVLDRKAGEIKPIKCLEALLLDVQISRTPSMLSKPTEFIAYYLLKGRDLKVYYYTSDAEGVSGMSWLVYELERDRNHGWEIIGNLHNHSFFLEDLGGDKPQGVLSPSSHDMNVLNSHAESLGLKSASITNGFHTVHIESDEFAKFKAAQ